jgi:hypothetical protein
LRAWSRLAASGDANANMIVQILRMCRIAWRAP